MNLNKYEEFKELSEAIQFADSCQSLRVWCSLEENSIERFFVTSIDNFKNTFLN